MKRVALFVLVLAAGCSHPPVEQEPGIGFHLSTVEGGWELLVYRPWAGASDTLRYALGIEREGFVHVPIPARRIVAFSATHAAFLEALGRLDDMIALAETEFVYSKSVRERVGRGEVLELVSSDGVDPEVLLALRPDVILFSGLSTPGPALQQAERAGIPVLIVGEWAETTPLNRAAWIQVIGALTGTHEQAERLFEGVSQRYTELAEQGRATQDRPVVWAGSPFRGTWYVPGGGSYMAELLRDAGAEYPMGGTRETGSLAVDEETVLSAAMNASVWLTGNRWATLDQALRDAPVISQLRAVREGHVYQADARSVPSGGTDFFETATVFPDRLLRDVLHILHPARFPLDSLTYYRRLN
jgi:iron complex transport system substrate-binding protein